MKPVSQSRHGDVLHGGVPKPCRDCPQLIIFVRTPARPGKPSRTMPVDADTDRCHFETCPKAQNFRRPRDRGAPPPASSAPPPAAAPPAAAAQVGDGFGPILTGRVLRYCPLAQGAVQIARNMADTIIDELKGDVVVIELGPDQKLDRGNVVKLRRLS